MRRADQPDDCYVATQVGLVPHPAELLGDVGVDDEAVRGRARLAHVAHLGGHAARDRLVEVVAEEVL